MLDVAVEGVSLLVTFRNEFAAVIERSGGRIAGLLDELRQRVAAERAQLAGWGDALRQKRVALLIERPINHRHPAPIGEGLPCRDRAFRRSANGI